MMTEATHRLLVVEPAMDPGPPLCDLLERLFVDEGCAVAGATDRGEAFDHLGREPVDLVVIDLALADGEGLEILRWLRRSAQRSTGVILLVTEEEDRVVGLELGADDCLVKPVGLRELALRIRRRLEIRGERVAGPTRLSAGPIEIDLERNLVRVDDRPVDLTLTEFRLLVDMVRNDGRVRTRKALMETLGSAARGPSRTIDTHVRRLRGKLGDAASWIGTVRGVGYRLTVDRLQRSSGADSR